MREGVSAIGVGAWPKPLIGCAQSHQEGHSMGGMVWRGMLKATNRVCSEPVRFMIKA